MKLLKKVSAVLACVCVLGAGSVFAQRPVAIDNASSLDAVQVDTAVMHAPVMYETYGKIVAIEDGRYVVKGEGNLRLVAAAVDRNTYVIDEKAKLRLPSALKIGQTVTVYYSAMTTRSLPAQSHAMAVVIGEREESTPTYVEVAEASLAADGQKMTILNSNNDLIATIGKDACADFAKIKKGDKLLLWSRVVTMSLPAQTNAEKVVVLP